MITQSLAQTNELSLTEQNGWPVQGAWRYADYLRLPDDGKRYEIIEGVLYMANAPSIEHQFTVSEIHFQLKLFIRDRELGQVYTSPLEVHLSETTKPVQPDILFIRAQHQPPPGTQFFDGAPALIVEVISPGSIRLDRHIKFDVYEKSGVSEYWLADPKARLVEVYTLSNGEYALLGQYTNDDIVESQVLAGLQIKTSTLFQSPVSTL